MSASCATTVSELCAGATAAAMGARPSNSLLPQFLHGHLPSNGCVGLARVLPPACLPSGPCCGGLPAVLLFLLPSRGDGNGWYSVEDLLTALLRNKRAGNPACRRARRRSKTIKFHWPAIRLTTQPRTVPLVRREGSLMVGEGPRARGPQRTSSAAPPSPARLCSRRSQSPSKRAAKRGNAPAVIAVDK